MSFRLVPAALIALGLVLPVLPASAQSPAQAFVYQQKRFQHACRPPLKFAAGACVRRCPAGYQDNGGYCRFRNQGFR